jgi:eukaryotic-like serine/threonine-protein kinase
VTQTGLVMGTASYLAPEQAMGLPATAASDRYALAVVAFELLTGEKPFAAEGAAGQARAHVEQAPPPPSRIAPDVPPAVDDVMARALAKVPEHRPLTATAFVDELAHALGKAEDATATTTVLERVRPAAGLADAGTHPGAGWAAAHRDPTPVPDGMATERTPTPYPKGTGTAAAAAPPPQRSRRSLAIAGAAALLLGGGIGAAVVAGDDDQPARSSAARTTQAPAATQDEQPAPQATAEQQDERAPAPRTTQQAAPAEPQATTPAEPDGSDGRSAGGSTGSSGSGSDPARLNDRGFALLRAGNPGDAVPLLQSSVEGFRAQGRTTELPYGFALFNLGRALRLSGRPGEAIPFLEERLKFENQRDVVEAELARARTAAGGGGGSDTSGGSAATSSSAIAAGGGKAKRKSKNKGGYAPARTASPRPQGGAVASPFRT